MLYMKIDPAISDIQLFEVSQTVDLGDGTFSTNVWPGDMDIVCGCAHSRDA